MGSNETVSFANTQGCIAPNIYPQTPAEDLYDAAVDILSAGQALDVEAENNVYAFMERAAELNHTGAMAFLSRAWLVCVCVRVRLHTRVQCTAWCILPAATTHCPPNTHSFPLRYA